MRRVTGFTLLELQIAIVLLAVTIVTLASVEATHSRHLKRLQAGLRPSANTSISRSDDPWVRKLTAAARRPREQAAQ